MHTAPNPGPPTGKPHDISFERESTIMRMIHTEGAGTSVREGSVVTVHFKVEQPGPEGAMVELYNSEADHPRGLQFEHGRTLHAEALDLAVKAPMPGFAPRLLAPSNPSSRPGLTRVAPARRPCRIACRAACSTSS